MSSLLDLRLAEGGFDASDVINSARQPCIFSQYLIPPDPIRGVDSSVIYRYDFLNYL